MAEADYPQGGAGAAEGKAGEMIYTDYVPDNLDAFEQYEEEQERRSRMKKRLAYAYREAEREDREDEYII